MHSQNAIELVKKFFEWIKEQTEIDLGIELGELAHITAKDFKNFSHEENSEVDERFSEISNKINQVKDQIINHLFSTETPKLFLLSCDLLRLTHISSATIAFEV